MDYGPCIDYAAWNVSHVPCTMAGQWRMDCGPGTTDHGPRTTHRVPWTLEHGPKTVHHVPWTMLYALCIMYYVLCSAILEYGVRLWSMIHEYDYGFCSTEDEYGARRTEYGVCSMEYGVWIMQCGVWSMEYSTIHECDYGFCIMEYQYGVGEWSIEYYSGV